MTKWRNFIGRESHVIAVQPPLISTRMELQKFYQRSYIVILPDLSNVINKMLDKILFHILKHQNGTKILWAKILT